MLSSDGESIFLNHNLKDDIERLNTDDVLGVILKIVGENAVELNFKIKFDVFSNTFYL